MALTIDGVDRWTEEQRKKALEELNAVLARRSLRKFVEFAWGWIEPRAYRHNWHIDVICEHLEAINRGDLDRLLINIPPRHGKPVRVDELVMTARGRIRLGDVCVGDYVLTHRGRFRRVEAVHEQGVLPVLKITTHCGRVVRANDEHPFLTPRGWIQAQHLTTADVLAAVAPTVNIGIPMKPEEARLLGYFVGDGSCKSEAASITCLDDSLADDIFKCCSALGFTAKWSKGKIPGRRERINVSGGVRDWLRKHGLAGQGSRTKRAPEAVINGDHVTIANFIAAYLGCDGWIGRRDGKRRDCVVQISSVNRQLLEDVQHLYLRLGINSRIREKRHRGGTNFIKVDGDYVSYNLDLCGQDDVWRFKQAVPMISEKGEKLAQWNVYPTGFNDVLKCDPIASIDRDEPAECRCLTVDEDHSFTVQDIAVHNSLIFSVFWPVWTWLQGNITKDGVEIPVCGPGTRFLFASYSERLSIRDSLRCRNILNHPVFRRNYKDVRISADQNQKIRFDIVGGGYRVATSVNGLATGEGGDIIGVDDPHNVKKAESEAVREDAVRWFSEVLPSRFNDQRHNALAVIMQRVHELDVSGFILAKELGYTHLCLPARYERNHPFPCKADRRTKEGELLWMSDAELKKIEAPLGKYQVAGQLQQRPAPREGGMFERHWFQVVASLPARRMRVRAWDIAGSVSSYDPDWTVGVLMSKDDQGYFYIEDVVRFRATSLEVDRQQRASAVLDGVRTRITVPQDPGSAGKHHAEHMIRNLAGFIVKAIRPSGEKEVRAKAFAAQAEAGNVRLVKAPWNNEFLNELCSFPNGRFDDQVDAASDAFNELAEAVITVGSKPMRW